MASVTDDVLAVYLDALHGMHALVTALDDDAWARPTDLPGWTVGDVVAHVNAIEAEMLGDPLPSHAPDWPGLPHVTDPFGQYTEVGVDYRRSCSREQVVAELSDLIGRRTDVLPMMPTDPDAEMRSPGGFVSTVGRVLPIRALDLWAHEQDIRRAVGRPGRLDSLAARSARDLVLGQLPKLVAKTVAAPPGTTVDLRVGAPLPVEVRITVDPGGRGAAGRPTPGEAADVVITTDLETFTLLAFGRASARRDQVLLTGDVPLAERIIDALVVTP